MPAYDPRGGGNVHIDVALSDISVGWPNNAFVADVLLPTVRVQKQTDKYYIFGREMFYQGIGTDVRAPGTPAGEIPGLAVSLDSYFAVEHALKILVTPEERENADSPLSPDRDATELVTSRIMLGRELAIKDLVLTAANYATGYTVTLSGTSQWNDYTNSDPIGDFRAGRNKIHSGLFLEPNLAIIPYEVMSELEDHPDFIERIKYSERGVLTAEIIAMILGIPRVIVPGVGYATNNPGQTETLAYIWGKDVLMAYVPPRAGLRIPAFGYEFVWPLAGRVQAVDRWYDEDRIGDYIRVRRRYDHKLVALNASSKSIAGYLIKSAVA